MGKLNVQTTKLQDVKIITPAVFGDHRGFFEETYSDRDFKEAGIDFDFVQDNQSLSTQAGVLRGLHFQRGQAAPYKGKPQNGQGGESSPLCGGDRVFPALFAGGNPNDCAEGACYIGKCPPQGGYRGEKSRHRGLSWQTCRAGGRTYPVCSLSPCGGHL